LACGIPSG